MKQIITGCEFCCKFPNYVFRKGNRLKTYQKVYKIYVFPKNIMCKAYNVLKQDDFVHTIITNAIAAVFGISKAVYEWARAGP